MPAVKKYGLKELIEKRLDDVRTTYKELCKGFEEEDIHQFRLSVKRLKALLRLLNYTGNHHAWRKSLKEVTAVYKACGQVRMLQIHQHVLASLPATANTSHLQAALKSSIEQAIIALKKAYKHAPKLHLKKAKRLFIKRAEQVTEKDISNYMAALKTTITTRVHEIPTHPEQWHELRKRIKELKYNVGLTANTLRLPAKLPQKADAVIGNWHDTVDTLQYMETHYPKRYMRIHQALRALEQQQANAVRKLAARTATVK